MTVTLPQRSIRYSAIRKVDNDSLVFFEPLVMQSCVTRNRLDRLDSVPAAVQVTHPRLPTMAFGLHPPSQLPSFPPRCEPRAQAVGSRGATCVA